MTGGCAYLAHSLASFIGGSVCVLFAPVDDDFADAMLTHLNGGPTKDQYIPNDMRMFYQSDAARIEETRGEHGLYNFRSLENEGLLHHGLWSMVHAYVLMPNGQAIDVYGSGDEEERLTEWCEHWELNTRWCARGVYPANDQTFLGDERKHPGVYKDESEKTGYSGGFRPKTSTEIDSCADVGLRVARIIASQLRK